jgi:trigger factor
MPFLFEFSNLLGVWDMSEEQEVAEVKNKVKIKDTGPCRKKISIEIPPEAIQSAFEQQYNDLAKEAVVPGFRKGRAPRRLIEKRFGKNVSEQVKLKLLGDAGDTAVKDNNLDILRDPNIDFETIELPEEGALTFDFEVEVRPDFNLPKLEAIAVKKSKLTVTDEQVERELDQLRKYSGVWTPREEGCVQLEDQLIADVIIKTEGVEEDNKLDNAEVYVRKNGFVGGIPVEKLDELFIDAKIGDEKQISVEVPKTYFREEYRGKKVDIHIAVRDIKWLKPADMDKNFLERFGVEDADELREKMRDSLQGRLEQQARSQMAEQIYKYLLDNTKFDLPTDIVADQAGNVLQRQYINLLQKGLPREQLAEQTEQLKASSEQQAEEQLKRFFIMDKVADKLGIEVSEEEINGQIAQLAIQQGQRPEKMREQMQRDGSLSQFGLQVRDEKCLAKLLESAQIAEIEPEKIAKKAKKSKKATKIPKKQAKETAEKAAPAEKKLLKKRKTRTKKKTEQ